MTVVAQGQVAQRTDNDASAIAGFAARVNAYAALRQKLERELPPVPRGATPTQIDEMQRALAARLQAARAGAKRGDIFAPDFTVFVKRLLNRVFGGPDGRQLRSSIMDENVKFIALRVNQRYPTAIPLTSMPPAVLVAMPKLPEELQYRFVGNQLILLDPHADLIPDFIPDALPGER